MGFVATMQTMACLACLVCTYCVDPSADVSNSLFGTPTAEYGLNAHSDVVIDNLIPEIAQYFAIDLPSHLQKCDHLSNGSGSCHKSWGAVRSLADHVESPSSSVSFEAEGNYSIEPSNDVSANVAGIALTATAILVVLTYVLASTPVRSDRSLKSLISKVCACSTSQLIVFCLFAVLCGVLLGSTSVSSSQSTITPGHLPVVVVDVASYEEQQADYAGSALLQAVQAGIVAELGADALKLPLHPTQRDSVGHQLDLVDPENPPLSLKRLGYYTEPSMGELHEMSKSELSAVKSFVVGRAGFGEVRWMDDVDLRDMSVDELVFIEKSKITVYGDADTGVAKPCMGHGLNKPAILTLENVFPAAGDDSFLQSVQSKVESRGATFIGYDESSGRLSFQVEHFTEYGLFGDDESETGSTLSTSHERRLATSSAQAHAAVQQVAVDSYMCACAPGYSGYNCEQDINECASSPCLHGGTCKQGVNSYTCTCAAGYTDSPIGTCYTELDECSSDPDRKSVV